jgi:hypothetical protein
MASAADAAVLTRAMLEALSQRWRASGAPIAMNLRPGLSRAEIRAATEPIGLSLPEEAIRWWEWHDGTHSDQFSLPRALGSAGGLVHLSLAEAIDSYSVRMQPQEAWERNHPEHDHVLWDRTWLPIASEDTGTVIACVCKDQSLAPVRALAWGEAASDVSNRGTRSFGELINWWIDAMDSDGWRYDACAGSWQRNRERLRPERVQTLLV